LGQGRVGEIWSRTVLRPSKSDLDETELFENEVNALRPTKMAFITTNATASASELVINSMLPYLDSNSIAIVGEDTSGKPVGQFAFDFDECDLRVRAVTFRTVNANNEGDYFTGLGSEVPNTCRAVDDFLAPFGSIEEQSFAVALGFLNGQSCTPFSTASAQRAQSVRGRELLRPARPTAAQYQIPGLF
jgi:hypothetical protein